MISFTSCTVSEKDAIALLLQKYPNSINLIREDNSDKITQVYIENAKNMTELPKELLAFDSLKVLEVSETSISEVPQFITEFKSLEKLLIEKSPVNEIPDIFNELPQLEHLDFSYLNISNLPQSIFESKKLTRLVFIETKIKGFPSELYKLENQLTMLYISKCEELPSDIYKFKNITHFAVELSKSFNYVDDLPKLEKLYLDNSTVSRFPKDFKTIKNLRALGLENCDQITELPASLGYAEVGEYDLVSFNFNGCKKLRGLPESFKNLKNIRTFYLDSCFNFSYIPLGLRIGSLTAIGANWLKMPKNLLNTPCTRLWIDGHRMGTIRGISGMKGLDFAVIINGNILKVPEELCEMKDLHHINLENNKIKNYPAFWKNCPELDIALGGNPL
ncbi:leucine-rich repeat domain-containing protein [Flammeovirga aprica]|uniref:Leucine-rich repeat domain-containing protein n=1 Tax=Flammeovirga aprica JL-4 TaxID=694437 RepID=A0A7X9NZB9_9BACT|nr:hypothetical protein [Flammeovirga aprica]NME66699.1 hypothetical protein [Flammeovirga aprica JL-4]